MKVQITNTTEEEGFKSINKKTWIVENTEDMLNIPKGASFGQSEITVEFNSSDIKSVIKFLENLVPCFAQQPLKD